MTTILKMMMILRKDINEIEKREKKKLFVHDNTIFPIIFSIFFKTKKPSGNDKTL